MCTSPAHAHQCRFGPLWLSLTRPSPTHSICLPSCYHPLPCITTGANYFLCRSQFRKPTLDEFVRICRMRLPVCSRCYAEEASDTHANAKESGRALVGSINAGRFLLSFSPISVTPMGLSSITRIVTLILQRSMLSSQK